MFAPAEISPVRVRAGCWQSANTATNRRALEGESQITQRNWKFRNSLHNCQQCRRCKVLPRLLLATWATRPTSRQSRHPWWRWKKKYEPISGYDSYWLSIVFYFWHCYPNRNIVRHFMFQFINFENRSQLLMLLQFLYWMRPTLLRTPSWPSMTLELWTKRLRPELISPNEIVAIWENKLGHPLEKTYVSREDLTKQIGGKKESSEQLSSQKKINFNDIFWGR